VSGETHHRRLENAYHAAVIHERIPMRLEVRDGAARVHFTATTDFHHAARSTHGSLCFKMLDDAAFFAVASREAERFWPTARFEVEFLRPVGTGPLVAEGRIVEMDRRRAEAAAEVRDEDGTVVARGSGTFARGRARWADADSYAD
jgi:uncharacterized protein (TIGR00369 family)